VGWPLRECGKLHVQLGGKKTHTLGYAAYACHAFSAHNLGLAAHGYVMYTDGYMAGCIWPQLNFRHR